MQKVVTGFNLNLLLKLFFYSLILTNNNLLLKIYCENIVVTFLNQNFLFFILFLISFISFRPYVFFFLLVFLLHTRCPISIPPFFLFSFSPHSRMFQHYTSSSHSPFFFLQPSLFVFFFFYLIPEHSSLMQSRQVIFVPKQLAQPRAVAHLHPQHSLDGSDGFCLLSFFFFFCFYCYDLINFKILFLSLYSDNLILLEFRDI